MPSLIALSLRSVVPALLIASLSFLSVGTAQAQSVWSNAASAAHPDASPQPNQAGPGAYSISFNSGPVKDPASGNYRVLVGQQCQTQINLPPIVYGTTVSCQWTVSGKTVQANSWNVASGDISATFSGLVNSPTLSAVSVSPSINITGPTWYWDDSTTSQTVTCQLTITPPAGQGAPTSKTVTQQVTLDIPTYKPPGSSVGTVQLDSSWGGSPGVPALHAGYGANNVPGILWKDTVTTPSFYGTSSGYWYHIQLISVSRYRTPKGSTTAIGESGDSVKGALDSGAGDAGGVSYVYGSISFPADGTLPSSSNNDSPGLALNDSYQEYNVKTESFQDFVMYQPAGTNSISVPLESFTWSWNADVKIQPAVLPPAPASWETWGSTAVNGTITSPGTPTQTLNYPTWASLRDFTWLSQ